MSPGTRSRRTTHSSSGRRGCPRRSEASGRSKRRKKALPDDRSRSASRKWKRVRAALGLAEERTQARSRLFLGDLLFFLLLLFLLLFLLLGGRRCRGSGGRARGGGPPGPVGVSALPPGGP